MSKSEQPKIVTFVACPPAELRAASTNPFIASVHKTLARKTGNLVLRVSSVRDIDLELSKILTPSFRGRIRIQIIGHAFSGSLALGAIWFPAHEVHAKAFAFPYYALDTNPAALGLLSKYAGKVAELMLVGCNIGSADASGYPVNGRTLTYALAELLRCTVLGADDAVAPHEFDHRGWYTAIPERRSPKGWYWCDDGAPPRWSEASEPARPRARVA